MSIFLLPSDSFISSLFSGEGSQGPPGFTFSPQVSSLGNLTWDNNGGLLNPVAKNLLGNKGVQGVQGSIGPEGEQGSRGQTGEVGLLGAEGVSGFTGVQGITGSTGPRGDKGEPGGSGAVNLNPRGSFMSSANPPYSIRDLVTFSDGRSYVSIKDNPDNIAPVGEDIDEFWHFISIIGPQGEKGAMGEVGVPGPLGDRGPRGLPGLPGFSGNKGRTGGQGDLGPIGPDGPQGAAGDRGVEGVGGTDGDKGPKGPPGSEGVSYVLRRNVGEIFTFLGEAPPEGSIVYNSGNRIINIAATYPDFYSWLQTLGPPAVGTVEDQGEQYSLYGFTNIFAFEGLDLVMPFGDASLSMRSRNDESVSSMGLMSGRDYSWPSFSTLVCIQVVDVGTPQPPSYSDSATGELLPNVTYFGKPVYRKVVEFTSGPSNGVKSIPLGIPFPSTSTIELDAILHRRLGNSYIVRAPHAWTNLKSRIHLYTTLGNEAVVLEAASTTEFSDYYGYVIVTYVVN